MKRIALSFALSWPLLATGVMAQEIPPRVDKVSTSIMLLCTKVEMHGRFHSIDAYGAHRSPIDVEKIETCSNAFQISKDQVVSAAHVAEEIPLILARYFIHKLATLQVYGFHAGHTPERIDRVWLSRSLVSFDGLTYTGGSEEYSASWPGKMEAVAVQKFLASLVPLRETTLLTSHTLEIRATDASRDLMLLSISPPRELEAYVAISKNHQPHDTAWGIAAQIPWKKSGPIDIIVTSGTVHERLYTNDAPQQSMVISMQRPTKGGYSGGFAVDEDGALIGVTHASSAFEQAWIFDIPHPCNDRYPCRRIVVSAQSVREFLKEHSK